MSDERINETLIEICETFQGVRVWRQNVAVLYDKTGRPVRFGIPGMADISGIGPHGVRLEIEMKREGKRHGDRKVIARQKAWGRMIRKHDGIYLVAESETEAIEALRGAFEELENKWTGSRT